MSDCVIPVIPCFLGMSRRSNEVIINVSKYYARGGSQVDERTMPALKIYFRWCWKKCPKDIQTSHGTSPVTKELKVNLSLQVVKEVT